MRIYIALILPMKHLIYKEFLMDKKSKIGLPLVLLYLMSMVIIFNYALISQNNYKTNFWHGLYWLIVLLIAIHSVSRIFFQENEKRDYYYYQICNPQSLIGARLIYNFILLLLINLLTIILFTIFFESPIGIVNVFFAFSLLGTFGLSGSLTLTSSIANKAGKNPVLLSVLSFPVIIPIIILSVSSINHLTIQESWKDLVTLFSIDILVVVLSLILFPYIWKS